MGWGGFFSLVSAKTWLIYPEERFFFFFLGGRFWVDEFCWFPRFSHRDANWVLLTTTFLLGFRLYPTESCNWRGHFRHFTHLNLAAVWSRWLALPFCLGYIYISDYVHFWLFIRNKKENLSLLILFSIKKILWRIENIMENERRAICFYFLFLFWCWRRFICSRNKGEKIKGYCFFLTLFGRLSTKGKVL